MNKLFKHILNIFILWLLLIPSFSSADSFVIPNFKPYASNFPSISSTYYNATLDFGSNTSLINTYFDENYLCLSNNYAWTDYWIFYVYYCSRSMWNTVDLGLSEYCQKFHTFSYWWNAILENYWNLSCYLLNDYMSSFSNWLIRIWRDSVWTSISSSNTRFIFDVINKNVLQSYFQSWYILPSQCPTCPSCPNQYTSLECQTEYNLIPIENVTKNYCEINFDLIDPSTCPITEWSWAVNWSSLFINGTQYAWNNSINMFIPNYLWRNITFNDEETNVEIEWYNVDEEYLNNIIDNEKLQPTNKDFENMLVWIVNFAPYIFICLIIYFLLSRLPKMFR